MAIKSPLHSFVDFENRITKTSLPSYAAQMAFQFYFPPTDQEDIDGDAVVISVADASNNVLFPLNATVIEACAWGIINNLSTSDFPVTVGADEIITAGIYDTIDDLYQALQDVGINAGNTTFIQCCKDNLQDYTLGYTTAALASKNISINFYRGVIYVNNTLNNQEADFESNDIHIGSCYKLAITYAGNTVYSNLFKRVDDTKYLAFFTYSNNEDTYDFHYGDGSLINALWFPFFFKNPSFITERNIYRLSNKKHKVLSSTTEEQWEATTDYFPKEIHQRLAVALEHDNKHVFSDGRYEIDEDITMNSDYNIAWPNRDIYDAPLDAQANFKVLQVFAGRNSNCEKRAVCIPLPVPGDDGGGGDDCVAVELTPSGFPDFTNGVAYDESISFTGSAPFTISNVVIPSWAIWTSPGGNSIRVTGTPDSDTQQTISFDVENDCGSESYSGMIEDNGVNFVNRQIVSADDNHVYETVQIQGPPGAIVKFKSVSYMNTNGGNLKIDENVVAEIDHSFTYTLDGSGLSTLISAKIDGSGTPGGLIFGTFNIYETSLGVIGSVYYYTISKTF